MTVSVLSSHMVYGVFSPKTHSSSAFYGSLMYAKANINAYKDDGGDAFDWLRLKWFVWTNWIENCLCVWRDIVNLNFDRIKYVSTNWWRSQML